MSESEDAPQSRPVSNAGRWIALGAGAGLVFGAAFGKPGIGLVLGAGVGLAYGRIARLTEGD